MRLDHLEEEDARASLQSRQWQADLQSRFSHIQMDWERLGAQLDTLLVGTTPRRRHPLPSNLLLQRRLQDLMRSLNGESDKRVLQHVADVVQQRLHAAQASFEQAEQNLQQGDFPAAEQELRALVIQTRAPLPTRRKRFLEKDPQIQPHLKAQTLLGDLLLKQGRLDECLEVQKARVSTCPSKEARLDLGAILQRQGDLEAATKQYASLPRRSSWRHYNLAAAALQRDALDEALGHLLQAFARGRDVVIALRHLEAGREPGWGKDYWERYGHLWDDKARRFFLAARAQLLVGSRVTSAAERGKFPRQIIQEPVRGRLLGWIMTALTPPGAESPRPSQSPGPSRPLPRKTRADSKPKKRNPSSAGPTKTRNN